MKQNISKKNRNYTLFMEDNFICLNKIEEYTKNPTLKNFYKDANQRTVEAFVPNFEIIGEAARNIPSAIKVLYTAVEWKEALNFRNMLIPDYFFFHQSLIRKNIQQNLPSLKKHLQHALLTEKEKREINGK